MAGVTRLLIASLVLAFQASRPAPGLLPTPAGAASAMYALATGADGGVYLSWIDPISAGGHALKFSMFRNNVWTAPREVARGTNWFVNWADHPSITAQGDGSLIAHWLVHNSGPNSRYAYGVRIARSGDQGRTWREIFSAGTKNEGEAYSGFVDVLVGGAGFSAAYLTPPQAPSRTGPGAHAEMETLAWSDFDVDGRVRSTAILDHDVCSCCNTAVAQTSSGPVVVYRDHQSGELRDISIVRRENGRWTTPALVHRDGWQLNACPTNGPAVAAAGARVGVAWFTMAGSRARVQFAWSVDGGRRFSAPVTVDGGTPVGRPDVVLQDDGSAVVSWLESGPAGAGSFRVRRVWPDGRLGSPTIVAHVATDRSTGIPQIVRSGQSLIAAWRTDRVQTAIVPIPR